MILKKNNFIVEYNEDLKYIPKIVAYLESKMKEIMFFLN